MGDQGIELRKMATHDHGRSRPLTTSDTFSDFATLGWQNIGWSFSSTRSIGVAGKAEARATAFTRSLFCLFEHRGLPKTPSIIPPDPPGHQSKPSLTYALRRIQHREITVAGEVAERRASPPTTLGCGRITRGCTRSSAILYWYIHAPRDVPDRQGRWP